MSQIPAKFKKYFWDTDIAKIDLVKNRTYLIERLLEYGNEEAIRWLTSQFPKETLIQVLKTTRNLSKKSANFWSLIYKVPKDQIRCLKKPSTKSQETAWPY